MPDDRRPEIGSAEVSKCMAVLRPHLIDGVPLPGDSGSPYFAYTVAFGIMSMSGLAISWSFLFVSEQPQGHPKPGRADHWMSDYP